MFRECDGITEGGGGDIGEEKLKGEREGEKGKRRERERARAR